MSIASELRHGGSPDCEWASIVDGRDLSNIELRGAILHLMDRIETLERNLEKAERNLTASIDPRIESLETLSGRAYRMMESHHKRIEDVERRMARAEYFLKRAPGFEIPENSPKEE